MAGQIIKRSERRWLTRVYLGRDAAGKRKFHSKTVHGTKKDAEAYLRDRLQELSRGDLKRPSTMTVNEFLNSWLLSIRGAVRARTHADYADTLKRYVRPRIGHLTLATVTPMVVSELVGQLGALGLSPRSVRKPIEVCRNAFEFAVMGDLLKSNPARNRMVQRTLPQIRRADRTTVSVEGLQAFRDAVSGDPKAAYFLLLLFGGLRPEEALALRWSDLRSESVSIQRVLVDRKGCPFEFEPTKSEMSRRLVQLPNVVLTELAAHRRRQAAEQLLAGSMWQTNDLIFCDDIGGAMRQDVFRRRLLRLLKQAGLPRMRVYDLRHSMASLLLERGVDLKVVQERLGHSSIKLTADTYAHLTPGLQQLAVTRLNEIAC